KVVERPYVGAGLVLYDAMEGPRRPVPHHRHLSARGALKRAPALSPDRLAGAMLYYDAQVDDARHTLTVARTAAAHSAVVATRVSAVGLLREPGGTRVTGARVRDEESGREVTVTAEAVVVCAGVWTDLVHELAGVQAGYRVRMSKGVHIVVPRAAVDANTGMILRTEKSVLFFIPWAEHWIVGTTDTDWSGDRAEPTATEEDIEYILAAANRVLAHPLTRADVTEDYGVTRAAVEHLLGRYGTLAEEVLKMIGADTGLARPLAEGHPYLRAEVAYAVTHEDALHVEDVLMRRTRLFIESADAGAAAAAEVSTIMGRLLGWSRRRRAAETRRYLDLVEAEQTMMAIDPGPAPDSAPDRALAAVR